jgi:hypothetical protein
MCFLPLQILVYEARYAHTFFQAGGVVGSFSLFALRDGSPGMAERPSL